jgi:actin-like ATPase involved in cell morphogenesis
VGVVKKLHRALWSNVAVDLGTVNTLVYIAGRGVVLDEPSVLTMDPATGDVVGVGKEAAWLYGRAPEGVEVIKPLHDGVISDPDACSVVVNGVDPTRWGRLEATEVPADLVGEALERSVSAILGGLGDLLAEVPPDLAEDVLGRGMYLAGGGALLHGLAQRISDRTSCKVTVVQDPLRCVLRGLAALLDQGGQRNHPTPRSYAA